MVTREWLSNHDEVYEERDHDPLRAFGRNERQVDNVG
jgi:hypothetical protein